MIRFGVLCLAIATSVQGQNTFGCPYKPKGPEYGVGYEPARLVIMDNSSNSCAITCESGYQLENRANYVECTNGRTWTAQQRETFTLQRLIDNPLLTCIKSVPKTCPAGTWKTFTCTNCDPSKIMVTPGTKGECTIMCDRGYRLVMDKGSGSVTRLAEATLQSSNWIMFALGAITVSESATASTASFNCEQIVDSKPDPTEPAGGLKCGCAYQPKTGTSPTGLGAYDPSKLYVVDGSDKTCTLACEKGYMLENSANYVECTNGQTWLGQNRESFGVGKLVDNPLLTCVKATAPKTCPAGIMKAFTCANRDPSKIMVTPGSKGECTIMCNKGFRLVGNLVTNMNTTLAEATWNDSVWTMYPLGWIQKPTYANAPAVSFNCESI